MSAAATQSSGNWVSRRVLLERAAQRAAAERETGLEALDELRASCRRSRVSERRQACTSIRHFVIATDSNGVGSLAVWTIKIDWRAFDRELGLPYTDRAYVCEREAPASCSMPVTELLQAAVLWQHKLPPCFKFCGAYNQEHRAWNPMVAVLGTAQKLQQLEALGASSRRDLRAAAAAEFASRSGCSTPMCLLCPPHWVEKQTLIDIADACVAVSQQQCRQLLSLLSRKQWLDLWDCLNDQLGVFSHCATIGATVPATAARGCTVELDDALVDVADDIGDAVCILLCVKFYPDCIRLSMPGVSANFC
jgi:hypothetical protein